MNFKKKCKEIYSKWKSIGKPNDHILKIQLRSEKQKLRKQQRIEQAIDRTNLYTKIMENPSTQLFYRLINRNRLSNSRSTNCIKIDGKYIFCPDEQRRSFAKYYEDLSQPKDEMYDTSYLNLCNVRQDSIIRHFENGNLHVEPFVEEEIIKSIDQLNTNKSSDEF